MTEKRIFGDRGDIDVGTVNANGLHGGIRFVSLIILDDRRAQRPEWIANFLEMKTVWHPIGV